MEVSAPWMAREAPGEDHADGDEYKINHHNRKHLTGISNDWRRVFFLKSDVENVLRIIVEKA